MKETLEEWIDEIESQPFLTIEMKALIVRLQLLLYKEKKSGVLNLDKLSDGLRVSVQDPLNHTAGD